MNRYDTFPTYVWEFNLFEDTTFTEADNEKLKSFLLTLCTKKDSGSRKLSNIGGYQSNDLDCHGKHEELVRFRELLETIMKEMIQDPLGLQNINFDNLWCNINYEHSYNVTHNHPFCFFSGVYYVSAKPVSEQGEIVFCRDDLSQSYLRPDKINHDVDRQPFSLFNVPLLPKTGTMFIFPSWVNHHVKPNLLSGSSRISLSFNFA